MQPLSSKGITAALEAVARGDVWFLYTTVRRKEPNWRKPPHVTPAELNHAFRRRFIWPDQQHPGAEKPMMLTREGQALLRRVDEPDVDLVLFQIDQEAA